MSGNQWKSILVGEELTCKRHWQCWAASKFSQTFSALKCQSLSTVSHASSLAWLSLQWSDLHSPGPHSILAKWRFPIKLQASGSSLLESKRLWNKEQRALKNKKSRISRITNPWKLQIPDLQRIFELVGSLVDLSSVSCHATQSVEKEMELSFIHIKLTSGSSRYSSGGPLRCLCTSVQTYHVGRATH